MKILINYAHNSHYQSQKDNTRTGLSLGGFNGVVEYNFGCLDIQFCNKNKHILENKRGSGYWLWKPYIILDALNNAKEGDYIFYCDSGAGFIHSIDPLIALGEDITLFHTDPVEGNIEALQTKRDAFILMNCETDKYIKSTPIHAGFQLYRKCRKSIEFVSEYLEWCQDERIISDNPNVMGNPNYPGFIQHRHDQSILSLLSKCADIPSFRDPTQFGNPYRKPWEYPQIINHTRNNM